MTRFLLLAAFLPLAAPAVGQDINARGLFQQRREANTRERPPVMGPSQGQLDAAAGNAQDWLYAAGDYSMRRYTALDQISSTPAAP